jgi:tetratricopeptide (TPR) repeat protein
VTEIAPDVAATVDQSRPWPGLASFTEENRNFFHGREDEVAELARRVQRKLLTVLFGQSGLGKTSILRAGLVPRLREQGYCPVYVRVDYSREAPEPAEQIKQAIARTARRAGEWTQAGVAMAGESLWEFLHHRDDVLQDEHGQTLIPLLIFDQFEEIFTLAQSDEFGRARAARFIADLADLVENRPPAELEARLESDDTTAERFDFARGDYRVLIALREDYLAPLEGLKTRMPSITQNRQRLAPMTGLQGLEAVRGPGGKLVTEEVAAAIVRFVAGGAELDHAQVEPSLLSLICRELNDTRIAQNRAEISLDLLAGSHESILGNFYERVLADQLPGVRRIIEDELLTDSGYRESMAEERLRSSFTAAGAPPDSLALLVNRRLLRIEERLDMRRVELTHDVLCSVVKRSRDLRHERESREATERLLAEQRAREKAARHALVRARQVAVFCIVLALGAVLAAGFAYFSSQRAKQAEATARVSRSQAEQLLGYLTDDFARELRGTGRLDVIADLAKREIEYFEALPARLQKGDTARLGAVALLQYAWSNRTLGRLDEASTAIDKSLVLLTGLRDGGDTSEATTIAMVRALGVRSRILNNKQDSAALPTVERAVALLEPLTQNPAASIAVRRAEVELLTGLGYAHVSLYDGDPRAVEILQRAMRVSEQNGARDPARNLYFAESFAEAGAWIVPALLSQKRADDARRAGLDAADIADQILRLRPGNMNALYSQGILQSTLGDLEAEALNPAGSMPFYARAVDVQTTLVNLDPGNSISLNNRASAYWSRANSLWSMGKTREALQSFELAASDMAISGKAGSSLFLSALRLTSDRIEYRAEVDDRAGSDRLLGELFLQSKDLRRREGADSVVTLFAETMYARALGKTRLLRSDWTGALRAVDDALGAVRTAKAGGALDETWRAGSLARLGSVKAEAELRLGNFVAAEASAREGVAARRKMFNSPIFDAVEVNALQRTAALALIGQHRAGEAGAAIAPGIAFLRDLQTRNRGDGQIAVELAATLYVQALIEPAQRARLLRESAAILDALPAGLRNLLSVRQWRARVREAAGA